MRLRSRPRPVSGQALNTATKRSGMADISTRSARICVVRAGSLTELLTLTTI